MLHIAGVIEPKITNFGVTSITTTQVTFSWNIPNGLDADITAYYLHYVQSRELDADYSGIFILIPFDEVIQSGSNFTYTRDVGDFSTYGQIITWIRIRRGSSPTNIYSEQLYVELG